MYVEVNISFDSAVKPDFSEIAIAFLGELPFDTFEESEQGLKAYALKESIVAQDLENTIHLLKQIAPCHVTQKDIAKENWNKQWEESYLPIEIAGKCVILAHFHQDHYPTSYIRLHIDPKMSFGTGHHQTTQLMIDHMLTFDFSGKDVLDVGCGTGVLGIMAKKLGANKIFGMDIDEWSMENTWENIAKNDMDSIDFDIRMNFFKDFSHTQTYEVILANINKNTILADMDLYLEQTQPGGYLFLSGFYEQDVEEILEKVNHRAQKIAQNSLHSWCSIVLKK